MNSHMGLTCSWSSRDHQEPTPGPNFLLIDSFKVDELGGTLIDVIPNQIVASLLHCVQSRS